MTWTDAQRQFQVGYPSGWRPTTNPSPSVVEFVGPGIGMEITAFRNATSTPAQQIDNIRANHPAGRRYEDGPTKVANVGGETGAFMQFQSFGLGNANDVHDGAFWVVKHAGTLYQLNGYILGLGSDDMIATLNAIESSLIFLR